VGVALWAVSVIFLKPPVFPFDVAELA